MNILFKEDAVCNTCGRIGAYDFGDEFICSTCYEERGSCCVEFGGYDLWKEKDKTTEAEIKKTKKQADKE